MSKTSVSPIDMHPADVLALVKKRGGSLAGLSRHHDLASNTLRNALYREDYPRGEKIIAEFLDMEPQDIWPERYAKRTTKSSVYIGTSSHVA
jgi:Ner family transcriptional regulator